MQNRIRGFPGLKIWRRSKMFGQISIRICRIIKMDRIMKNNRLFLDRVAWCPLGFSDRQPRASPEIRVRAIRLFKIFTIEATARKSLHLVSARWRKDTLSDTHSLPVHAPQTSPTAPPLLPVSAHLDKLFPLLPPNSF